MSKRIALENKITATAIVVVIFASILISCWQFENADTNKYSNELRIIASRENANVTATNISKGELQKFVINCSGIVLYSDDIFGYKKGDYVDPNPWLGSGAEQGKEFKDYYVSTQAMSEKQVVWGFSMVLIPKAQIKSITRQQAMGLVYLPILVGGIFVLGILCVHVYRQNRKFLLSICEISSSAKAIIEGNYDLEVVRTYGKSVAENEVGDLIFSFELMRDELKDKQVREEQLKKAQQELISCISHDLRTPISTIKAYSEGIRDGVASTEREKQEYVEVIIRKTDLLIKMIKELLEYSNTQLHQLAIAKTEVFFRSYMEKQLRELDTFVSQNNAELTYEVNISDCLVEMDAPRITEVLYNLVENSLKYRGDKPCQIHIVAEREEQNAVIRIRDNGIGIGAEDIPYVFDKFYRAEKSRSMSVPGSGLGLSICRYILEEHNGTIACQLVQSGGCQFRITLPIQ